MKITLRTLTILSLALLLGLGIFPGDVWAHDVCANCEFPLDDDGICDNCCAAVGEEIPTCAGGCGAEVEHYGDWCGGIHIVDADGHIITIDPDPVIVPGPPGICRDCRHSPCECHVFCPLCGSREHNDDGTCANEDCDFNFFDNFEYDEDFNAFMLQPPCPDCHSYDCECDD